MTQVQPSKPDQRVLVVIPARGGSKEIPRKNLCPIGGKPLIAWVIEAALAARVDRVLVTTDDERIALTARRVGAEVLMRDPELARDAVTLDPVVYDAVQKEEGAGRSYDLVLTVQPTSPLLRASTIRRIIDRFNAEEVDTILTALDDTHLAWEERDGKPVPVYTARVNRQHLPRRYRETGGVLATRRACITSAGRIGKRVQLETLAGFEGLDIDTADDWLTAEAALGRKRIAFFVIGNRTQGLGHVSRVLTLLESLNSHHTRVFCTPEQELAISTFESAFYKPECVSIADRMVALERFGADIVIHDELDTDPDQLRAEKAAGMKVVVFEDLGPGQQEADLVFNALFPEAQTDVSRKRFFGPDVYCLRDEFRHAKRNPFRERPERILITFGGTDPSGLTQRVLSCVATHSALPITVVAGRGLADFDALEKQVADIAGDGRNITLHRDAALMSELMGGADIAFSSAGRTLYELTHMAVPTIVLAQNDVEMMHRFASIDNGFIFLGKGVEVSDDAILAALQALLSSVELRRALHDRMLARDLTRGRDVVVKEILESTP